MFEKRVNYQITNWIGKFDRLDFQISNWIGKYDRVVYQIIGHNRSSLLKVAVHLSVSRCVRNWWRVARTTTWLRRATSPSSTRRGRGGAKAWRSPKPTLKQRLLPEPTKSSTTKDVLRHLVIFLCDVSIIFLSSLYLPPFAFIQMEIKKSIGVPFPLKFFPNSFSFISGWNSCSLWFW